MGTSISQNNSQARTMDFEILKRFDQIESYVDDVVNSADKNKKSLGFLPRPAYQEHALQGRLWTCIDAHGAYCGHLIFGGKLPSLRVLQIFIHKDYRGQDLGSMLLHELEQYGKDHHCLSISARVAADLKANQFWERQGYIVAQQVDGGKTTGRRINIRVKDLDVPSLFDVFAIPHETQHTDLTVKAKTVLTNRTYALDVNVLLDLVKNRDNANIVQNLFSLSLYGSNQICITSEFIAELERQTSNFSNDPLLSLARSLPVLPSIPQTVLEPVVSQLRSTVFPERQEQNCLNENDQSDLSHIAQCIHHDITGFITSEKAILKASEILFYNFGIEILSPSDLANSATSSDNNDEGLSLSHNGSDLVITKFDEKNRQQTESFLRGQGVTEPEIRKALASGVVDRPRARWLVTHASAVKGFSSWGGDELDSHRVIYLVIDELFPLAQKLIDHFIEKVTNSLPSSKITLLALYTTIGNDLTRKTAIDRGFRKKSTENLVANASRLDLIKISYKGYVTNTSWQEFREAISQSIELCLPERMPTFDEFVYTGAVITSKAVQGIVKLPLFEMETIFSPTVFLCAGRGAIIVPIKKPYVDRLLAVANNQLSLLPSNEALLHVEKAYFRSTRNAKMFQRGELLLFYVSGKDGGQEIIGHGRITSSQVISVEAAILQLQRQGALKEQGLHDLSDSDGNIHAITFDNFCFFRHPIPYLFLKRNQIISGANLVTAEKIYPKNLIRIINEGEPHE